MFNTLKRYLNRLSHTNTLDIEHLNYDFYVFFNQDSNTNNIKDYNICCHCESNILKSIYMFKSKPFCENCITKYNKCLY